MLTQKTLCHGEFVPTQYHFHENINLILPHAHFGKPCAEAGQEASFVFDEECPVCGALNTYSWADANEENADENTEIVIYHIPTASGFEWECGKCHAHLVEADSPLNHPCYTHEEEDNEWNE